MKNFDKKSIDAKVQASLPFNHKWHNNFHLEAPFGLINDPNGLAFLDGKYHVFFQWNPYGCEHKNKCWCHVTTEDFVNYTKPELSMWPTDGYDMGGCYSGSGFAEDGKVRLLYTNNVKDEQGNRLATQRIATLLEDGSVSKDEIVVHAPAAGFTAHYRDPYYFKRDGEEYMVIGAQRDNETGSVVMYKRDQKAAYPVANEKWSYVGEIKTAYKNFGYMWECPGLMQLKDAADGEMKDVLLFCPQGLEAEKYQYQNLYQSGYVAGKLDMDKLTMKHDAFVELDKGFDFYAPQVLVKDDRHILFGWMGMPEKESEYPTAEEGWLFSLTMPRELTLKNNHVYSAPVKELEALRTKNNVYTADNTENFHCELSKLAEVELSVALGDAKEIKTELAWGDDKLVLSYNRQEQAMTLDRNGMGLGGRGVRCFELPAENELKIRLFVDKAAVEAFMQDGHTAASTLIFKQADAAPSLNVTADGLVSVKVNAYELKSYTFR